MSTVTQPKIFNHEESQRKVRHPLYLVRASIRRYIILEGLALTLLFASILFWAGLAVDFGLYKFDVDPIFGLDWILALNDVDPSGGAASLGIRVVLLGLTVVGLAYLGFTRVVTRWFREFNDQALALVLERRFPKELGDRLITAVELADPKLATKYGYSQAMVEKTIVDAIERLKKLPVSSVFNWGRLFGLWLLLGVTTVGVLLVVMGSACVGSALFSSKGAMSPITFAWKFYDVSSIWTERNILMMNTYWPRRAYLEIGRFQRSKENPNEMRIARDDPNRPDLQVRAYEWVIADRDRDAAPHGWRALTWKDLSDRKLIDPALLARVRLPADFPLWFLDPEELEPNLVAALFDTATHERTSAELRNHFQLPNIKRKVDDRNAQAELDAWLDWQTWKMDKIHQQMEEGKVDFTSPETSKYEGDFAALREIFEKLNELAEAPSMSRTLRKLDIPKTVDVSFRGKMGSFSDTRKVEAGNKYTISLKDLKDSPEFRFLSRGEDYFTQPKMLTLVAAPTPARILVDKEEPAYIYHRLRGIDQMPLQGERHLTPQVPVSTTGEANTIEVPMGTNLTIHVQIDGTTINWGGLKLDKVNFVTQQALKLPATEGLLVTAVDADSAAARAGVQANDVLVKMNGAAVPNNLEKFAETLSKRRSGDPVQFDVIRKEEPISLQAAGMPEAAPYKPRKLRNERAVFARDHSILPEGFDHFRGKIVEFNDKLGFSLLMENVTRSHEFSIEFFDEDNIKGKRKFKVVRVIDTEPQLGNLHVHDVLLRKAKFKLPERGKDNDAREVRDLSELSNSYLVTPDAIIPFECNVKDEYGLVRVGYTYKYRVEDFDPFSPTATKKAAQNPDAEQVNRRAGLILSNFQFWPGNPQSWKFGPHFLGWTAQQIELDLAQTQKFVEGEVPAAGFNDLLAQKEHLMIFPGEIKANLNKKRTATPWEFDFSKDMNRDREIGLDLRLHLPGLKTVDLEKFGQTHYILKVAVQATDNNVETGAPYTVTVTENNKPKTLLLKGNTRRNKNGYINFFVVSENELLSQIALEEEILFEKLETAKEKIDAGITSLQEQLSKIENDKNVDMENVLNRMNEIRTNLSTSGTNLREADLAYENILKELRINRVKANRKSFIENKIFQPLHDIVFPDRLFPQDTGSFPHAEEAFGNAHAQVEKDVNLSQRPNALTHRANMNVAEKKLVKLSNDLKTVLDAMSEGIVEAKLIAILASIERRQYDTSKILEGMHRKVLEDLLKGISKDLGIDPTPPEPKKEEKKELKKTSQRESDVRGSLAAILPATERDTALLSRRELRAEEIAAAVRDRLTRTGIAPISDARR